MKKSFEGLRTSALGRIAGAAAIGGAVALAPISVGADEPRPNRGRAVQVKGAEAAPVILGSTISAAGVDWIIDNNTSAITVAGLGLTDATFTVAPSKGDSYDGALVMSVDGVAYADPDGTVDITGTTLTADPAVMSGLNVSAEYYFLTTEPTVRAMWVFTNPTAGPISVNVDVETNYGSDSNTQLLDTSSGDAVMTDADRWILSWQGPGPITSDPIIAVARSGPGAALTPTVTNIPGPGNGVSADRYALTVPAGMTRRIVVFHQLNNTDTIATAQTRAATFDSDANMTAAGYWAGLTAPQQAEIVNFAPGGPPATIPTLQEWAMGLLAGLLALIGATVAADRLRRRQRLA